MKYLYIKLWGYKAIKTGMHGRYEYEMDFSKCKYPIIMISGPNGIGKSTILNAMSLEVDPPSCYTNGVNAGKELFLLNGNIMYHIFIESKVNSKGDRQSTKVSFQRNGEELNYNGNVTSYYEILESEFNLDSNYLALTMMSIVNRGLADKIPSERKKIVGSIVGSLEVYNNMNKIFSKKSTVYKSNINTLVNKLAIIGDETSLRQNLTALNIKIESLEQQKLQLHKELAKAESYINILDPNKEIQNLYQRIYDSLKEYNSQIKEIDNKLVELYRRANISPENLVSTISNIQSNIFFYKNEIDIQKQKIDLLLSQHAEDIKVIMAKQTKIDSINLDDQYYKLMNTIDEYKRKIEEQEHIMNILGVKDFNLSKDELIRIAKLLKEIKNYIYVIRDNASSNIILYDAGEFMKSGRNIESELSILSSNITVLKNQIEIVTKQEALYNDAVELLKKRPKECAIDTCDFISHALNTINSHANESLDKINIDLNNLLKKEQSLLNIADVVKNIEVLCNAINLNRFILSKVKITSNLLGSELIDKIVQGYPFNELEDIDTYIQYADIIDGYRTTKETLLKLYGDAKVYNERVNIITELESELMELNKKVSNTLELIEQQKKTIEFNNGIIEQNEKQLALLNKLKDLEDSKSVIVLEKNKIAKEYENIKTNIGKIHESIDAINNISNTITCIDKDIIPLNDEREKIKYSLTMLSSYLVELQEAKDNYNFMEILKKHSSPTKEGIQVRFLKMYMQDTLMQANQLASLIYGDQLSIKGYEINEKEFRIPCLNNGMEVDDISSCSLSQVCMLSMIISLVLLKQSSTLYNIVRLDEIDNGLDEENRRNFITVLYALINLLQIEQVFIVSHNSEFDTAQINKFIIGG